MQANTLFCLCCLDTNVPFYNLANCSHSEFLDSFSKPKLKPLHQVICYLCHRMLKKIKLFKKQVEDSFKTLEFHANNSQFTNHKQTKLKLHKMANINIHQADSENNEQKTNTEIQNNFNNVVVTNESTVTENTKPKSINDEKKIKNMETALSIINKNKNDACIQLLLTSLQSIATCNLTSISQSLLSKSGDITNNSNKTGNSNDFNMGNENKDDTMMLNKDIGVDIVNENKILPVAVNPKSEEAEKGKPVLDSKASNLINIKTIKLTREELMQERASAVQAATYLKTPYHCESCIVGFHYKENLDDHINRKHTPKPGSITCDVCLQVLHPPESSTAHSVRHFTRYKCFACGKQFISYEEANLHHKREHSQNSLRHQCRHCKYKTNSKKKFRCHILKNHCRATCKVCGARYMTFRKLKTHIDLMHAKSTSAQDGGTPPSDSVTILEKR